MKFAQNASLNDEPYLRPFISSFSGSFFFCMHIQENTLKFQSLETVIFNSVISRPRTIFISKCISTSQDT